MEKREYNLYKDIQCRTNGEIYIGVVGPVRTGKSTFIKKFMDLCVIPYMEDVNRRERTMDELPQSAQGKTIMTTEPKFVPQEAARISLEDQSEIFVRLVDCVGFLVPEAMGYLEDGDSRMVKTPWYEEDVPFEEAAQIGTRKVIHDHSTIAVMVTTDGSFGDIARENYEEAEKQTVDELKKSGKPFVIVLNTIYPYRMDTLSLKEQMEELYGVTVIPTNCLQMQTEDVHTILESVLYQFPVTKVNYFIPKWVEMLSLENPVKQVVVGWALEFLNDVVKMKDLQNKDRNQLLSTEKEQEIIKSITIVQNNLCDGTISVQIQIADKFYFENISQMAGVTITGEGQMIALIQELTSMKREYEKVREAFHSVQEKGYGVVMPELSDITMEDPVLIQHGSKYGVKMNAVSPSIHMIRANIETEIAPIVGNKEQAEDLITYIKEGEKNGDGVWTTNIFGKSIGELMEDGIRNKISQMDDECKMKLQDTMQKIVNDSNGGMVCIII